MRLRAMSQRRWLGQMERAWRLEDGFSSLHSFLSGDSRFRPALQCMHACSLWCEEREDRGFFLLHPQSFCVCDPCGINNCIITT
jgi:hypothetical protein